MRSGTSMRAKPLQMSLRTPQGRGNLSLHGPSPAFLRSILALIGFVFRHAELDTD
jgi:hypothetical protein